ncbi:MAG: succinylglutamate desuccinylase/aspartoacylase family protein [Verrucomicrobiae bacterium]|nr:succinylglutamate desuccinylase/aspartoacylase family protein [Verrucomicrobiae bacterium]
MPTRLQSPEAKPPRPLTIGGEDFYPGDRGVVDIPIGSLIDYQPVTMTVHVLRGKKPGPCLLVSAALHGDEIIGVEVIRRLLRSTALKRLRGDLIVVPVVNMPAFLSHSRYLPDRRDLNRLFPGSPKGSLGGRLAYAFLNQVVMQCTHAIDMHTGAVGRPNLPQIRVSPGDHEGYEMAKAFKPPVVIETSLRAGSLRETLYSRAKPCILYEAGEAHRLDSDAVRYGLRGVVSVMRYLEMLPQEKRAEGGFSSRRSRTVVSTMTSWSRAPRGGVFAPEVGLGKAVTPNMELGVVADPFGRHETPIKSRVDGVVIGISREATVNEGDGLFHIAVTQDPARAESQILQSDEQLEEHQEERAEPFVGW